MSALKPTLREKQDSKSRWLRNYRASHRALWAEMVAREPRLLNFRRFVRQCETPAQLLVGLADSWVRTADKDIRHAALRQIDRQANRHARWAGRPVLDDPLPPATNVFLTAKQMLSVQ